MLIFVTIFFVTHINSLLITASKNYADWQVRKIWDSDIVENIEKPCLLNGNYSSIKTELMRIIEFGDKRAWTNMGRVLWVEGNCEDAIDAWKKAWKFTEDPISAYELMRSRDDFTILSQSMREQLSNMAYHRGIKLDGEKKYALAITWIEKSLMLVPRHESATKLADLYNKMGVNTHTKQIWIDMINRLSKEDSDYWWAIGELYLIDNNWTSAAHAFTQGAELADDPHPFLMQVGYSWYQANNWKKAIKTYEEAIRIKPNYWWSYIMIGKIYKEMGDYDTAIQYFLKVKDLDPNNPSPYFHIGEIFYIMHDLESAYNYFNEALKLDTNNFMSKYYIALILYDENKITEAEQWMEDAIQSNPWKDMRANWWIIIGDWRVKRYDCDGALIAYINAQKDGATEQILETKLNLITNCQLFDIK